MISAWTHGQDEVTDARPGVGFDSAVGTEHKVAGTLRCAVSQGSMCISLNTADGTWNVPATMSLQSTPWPTTLDQAPMSGFYQRFEKTDR